MDYKDRGTDLRWKKKLLFSGIFIQENRLHAIMDRYGAISSKQWLLLAVCKSMRETADLTTVGLRMGCSRQNVRKLALALEKEGFVEVKKSETDARSSCIRITEKGTDFLNANAAYEKEVHEALFGGFTEEELETYFEFSVRMMEGLNRLEEWFEKREGGSKG